MPFTSTPGGWAEAFEPVIVSLGEPAGAERDDAGPLLAVLSGLRTLFLARGHVTRPGGGWAIGASMRQAAPPGAFSMSLAGHPQSPTRPPINSLP